MEKSKIKNSREKEDESASNIESTSSLPKKIKPKKSKNIMIEEYLNSHYQFRYNVLKSRAESYNHKTKEYTPVDKYVLNSIRRELDAFGIYTNIDNISSIITSDFVKKVNPIQEYFLSLPNVNTNSISHITQLANTVRTRNMDIWHRYFTKWLVAVIANAITNEGCQNHTCLVLTGEQGIYKTTWLDYLCPKSLSRYLYTGKIDPQNKDTLTYISEYLFVNIDDQLRELNKKDENSLKALITAPFVKYRRPYGTYIEEYPHIASFMASINGVEFLTDPTGSRRFLPFIVENIDCDQQKQINMDLVYSEAKSLFHNGFKYWFDSEEIKELHEYSSEFQIQTNEYEVILKHFETPIDNEKTEYMTASEIITHINSVSNIKASSKRVGEALKKAGFNKLSKRINGRPIYVYPVSIRKQYSII